MGRQTVYTYDLAGHLTSVTRPNNTLRTIAYDADGELTNIVEQTTSHLPITFYTLNYNLAGRVQWEFKGPLPHAYTPPTRNMTFENDNRLLTFNTASVSVDGDGNMTYGPGTNNTFGTYTYDLRNRLTSAGGISYGYDLANNRVSLTSGANMATYVIEPQSSQVLMRIESGTATYYIYGAGLAYEIEVTATTTNTAFYHFDSRGSTVMLTDINGNITDQIEYSPYGTTTYRVGTNNTPFLYNGRYGVQTDTNGLLYMRARYYNPYISRFINADPSGFGGGLNFYLFCNDNPINAEDPFGLDPGYGNPVSGPFGPVGPSSAFASGMGYYPNGVFYTPTPITPTPLQTFAGGVIVGAGVAAAVVVAAPVAVELGATAITMGSLGTVTTATATTVSAAAVDTGLMIGGSYGGYTAIVNTSQQAGAASVTGNWNAAAGDFGALVGGGLVGVSGGGRAMAEGMMDGPSPAPNTWNPYTILQNEIANAYNPNYPNGSTIGWLGSSPTPFSGGLTATGIAGGTTSQSSPSGK